MINTVTLTAAKTVSSGMSQVSARFLNLGDRPKKLIPARAAAQVVKNAVRKPSAFIGLKCSQMNADGL